ncbi:DUF3619 family protein [Ramlibacter sp. AN1015]|uniref:DUF3619 family protein n=1 Tax=Ramlibacter sp. AN1015 TaxID=3133428 RepID=UPI0030C3607C
MNTTNAPVSRPGRAPTPSDAFGERVAARLAAGAEELPHDITERLRAAREQAMARRKPAAVQPLRARAAASAAAPLGSADGSLGLWGRIAAALPAVVLAAGLVALHLAHNDERARQVAEVDAALLTDELPPAAYTDPGFLAFVRRAQ